MPPNNQAHLENEPQRAAANPGQAAHSEAVTDFPTPGSPAAADRAVKASSPGGLRPALTALPPSPQTQAGTVRRALTSNRPTGRNEKPARTR